MTSSKELAKEVRERKIFVSFLKARGLHCAEGDIQSRKMPEPDILWSPKDATPIAYELVEILDEKYARSFALDQSTKDECYAALEALDEPLKSRFQSQYSDSDIFISFRSGLHRTKRGKAIPHVLKRMLDYPVGVSGMLLVNEPELSDVIDYVCVSRGIAGPLFDAVTPVWLGEPSVRAIASKAASRYVTPWPTELLAYFERNPMLPEEIWLGNVEKYCSSLDADFPFAAIYVFDLPRQRLRFTWKGPIP